MRNATPTGKNKSDGENEKNSGKKLVQARLPFKILAPGSTPSSETSTATEEVDKVVSVGLDARKRKLSYDSNDDVEIVEKTRRSGSKENVKDTGPKKQKTVDTTTDEVVLLDDSSDEEELKAQKSNVKKTPKTKVVGTAGKGKKTPKNVKNAEQRKSAGGSGQKLQIKLPVSNSKKHKKRKPVRKMNTGVEDDDDDEHVEDAATAESSDDIEMLAGELNPQKRPKHDSDNEAHKDLDKGIEILDASDAENVESETKEPPKESKNEEKIKSSSEKSKSPREDSVSDNSKDHKKEEDISSQTPGSSQSKLSSDSKEQIKEDQDISVVNNEKNSKEIESEDGNESSDIDDDDDDGGHADKDSDINSSRSESFANLNDSSLATNKNLTPKQKRYLLQRRKARVEKERKLAEEKRQKQQEKEEKELAKKRDREEKEEQKRKDREEKEEQRKREKEEREEQKRKEKEEKEEQRRKEREEKEKKRLAEIEAKKKRIEAKEEEQRKKDEDKRRKEQEKEEAELKKRKAAEAFTKFFVAKPTNPNCALDFDQVSNDSNSVNETALAFRPFQIKGDMTMAPILRKIFTPDSKERLDKILHLSFDNPEDEEEIVSEKPLTRVNLYLVELKTGKITPAKWRKQAAEYETKDDDVILVEDDLEREGQEIIEESHPPVESYRAKFYKFHENRRPPYYGTWRKKSEKITPRKPFVQDQKYFDYEVDSDLEWEEEEPGESLDGSDDDKEKESEDEDYEVDNEWFVPHGHLSEEEMQNEDEIGGEDDNTREAQKAKLKILQQEFAQEMKKKTEKIKPRLVGCIWVDENGNHPDLCPKIIWEKLDSRAMLFTETPLVEEPTNSERLEPSSPSTGSNTNTNGNEKTTEKLRPIAINSRLQKDLIRLIHGNTNSKVFLIKEFIAFVEANEDSVKNGDFKGPLKSAVKDKIDEFAEWKIMELNGMTTKNKKTKKYLCWVVDEAVLEKMDMKELDLKNDWQYLLTPKRKETPADITPSIDAVSEPAAPSVSASATEAEASLPQDSGKSQQTLDQQFLKQSRQKNRKPIEANPIPSSSSPATAAQGARSLSVTQKNEMAQNERKEEPPSKKKRVPLLMSVARGQQFATPAKNALISQFLKKSSEAREHKESPEQDSPDSNDVIVLE